MCNLCFELFWTDCDSIECHSPQCHSAECRCTCLISTKSMDLSSSYKNLSYFHSFCHKQLIAPPTINIHLFGAMTIGKTTLPIMTFDAGCCYAECHLPSDIMLSIFMLSISILSIFMWSNLCQVF